MSTFTIASDVLRIALNVASFINPGAERASLRISQSSINFLVVRYCTADGYPKNNLFSIVGALSAADVLPAFALSRDAGTRPIWRPEDVDYNNDEDYVTVDDSDDESRHTTDGDDEVIDLDDIE